MLALRSGRLPLVNPAVYSFAGGSLWMTTSRYAAKTIIAKRDPRAAFLVDVGAKAVLLLRREGWSMDAMNHDAWQRVAEQAWADAGQHDLPGGVRMRRAGSVVNLKRSFV